MHCLGPVAVKITDTRVYGSNVPSSMNCRSPDPVRLAGSSSTMAPGPSAFSSTSTDCSASRTAGPAGLPPTCNSNSNATSGSRAGDGDQGPRREGTGDHGVVGVADAPEGGGVVQVAER